MASSTISKNICLVLTASTAMGMTPFVLAAGFQIFPTASGVARAIAGAGIQGTDAADMFFNPAGMALMQGGRRLAGGMSHITQNVTAVNQSSALVSNATGAQIPVAPAGQRTESEGSGLPGSFFYNSKLGNDSRLTWGIGFSVPYGLVNDYELDWFGRYQGISSELEVMELNGALAYRLSDTLSLGAGVLIQNAEVKLTQAVPTPTGDGYSELTGKGNAWGLQLGLVYQPVEAVHIGLAWRSQLDQKLAGLAEATVQGQTMLKTDVSAVLPFPDFYTLSGVYKPENQRWSLSAGLQYSHWSRFQTLAVNYRQGGGFSQEQNWDNTLNASIAVDYKLSENDKVVISYSYENSATPSAEFRSVRVPDADREIIGLGYERNAFFCESCTAIFSMHRTMNGERQSYRQDSLSADFSSLVAGRYESSAATVIAMQLQYDF